MRMTALQYRSHGFKKGNKYNAKRTLVDGITFDSKLEADYYVKLKGRRECGVVKWFIRQVPFGLPGGITWRADFLVVWSQYVGDQDVEVIDCKGVMTDVARIKIAQVEALYGITVKIVRKA